MFQIISIGVDTKCLMIWLEADMNLWKFEFNEKWEYSYEFMKIWKFINSYQLQVRSSSFLCLPQYLFDLKKLRYWIHEHLNVEVFGNIPFNSSKLTNSPVCFICILPLKEVLLVSIGNETCNMVFCCQIKIN